MTIGILECLVWYKHGKSARFDARITAIHFLYRKICFVSFDFR
jgi:hypothetical protein